MGEVVDPDLRAAAVKTPSSRDEDDVNRIFSYLVGVEALTSARESSLRSLATKVRYKLHEANDILYCRGELSTCWFVLLSGSVFIDGSMFLPRSSFGRRTPGCGRRQNECIILEASELLYVDYPDAATPGVGTTDALKDAAADDAAAVESIDVSVFDHQLPPPQLPAEFPPAPPVSNGLARTDSFLKRTSHASDTSSAYSGSDMMQSSLEDPVDPADVDLNGLVESFVDSDDEDLESLGSSLVYRDSVRECLEKDHADRTDEDVEILLDFMGHLPAFANMTNPVRREFCACTVFAVIERAGTVVMNDGEELDSWSVILNGRVEITRADVQSVEYLDVGDSFGITPTTEKLYHKGVMKTLVDDCQFVCIAQTDYYRILHRGEENTRKHEEEGEVVMITEHRTLDRSRQGQIIIRGTPERLTDYLVADHSSVDPTFVEDFLLTARTFLESPQSLADRLLEWFQDPNLRAKATRVVLLWVNNHFNDFETDADMCDFLEKFEDRLEEAQMQGQLRLLNIASAAKAHARSIILKRSSRDEPLDFAIVGGREKGHGVFVSKIDRDSRAFEAGLKRGDQILSVNTQSFEHITNAKAFEILQGSTHLSISVKTNFLAFKEMLFGGDGHKRPRRDISLPRIKNLAPNSLEVPVHHHISPTRDSRDAGKKKNKISNMLGKIINSNSKSNLLGPSHLNDSNENLFSPTTGKSLVSGKNLSSSNPDLSAPDFPDLDAPGVASEMPEFAVRVYRSDQTCRYLLIHKETTAKEVVMLALKEFGVTDLSSSDFSLCQVSVQDGGLIKHSRLPDILNDLAQRIPLNARYYIKSNHNTEQLVSDEVAAEMLKEANISFLQLNPMEIAFQLTLQDFEVFSEIEPTEFIDNLFERDSRYGEPMLERFEELVNREMFWVSTEVTSETNRVNRMKILKHFVKIAKYCKQCKNFNSMFAILSGLGHGSVSRLRATWEKLPTKYSKLFTDLQEVMDPSRNMAKYRNLLNSENVQPPMIPFFPVVKKDLTFICLGNDSKIEGLINFEKLRMLAKEIRHVGNMCSSKYDAQAMQDYVNASPGSSGHHGVTMNGMATLRRRGHPRRHSYMISAKKIYEESQMARKVRTYLSNLKIVDDEDKLHEASVKLEPPLGMKRSDSSPAPTPVSRPGSSLSSTSGFSVSSAGQQQHLHHPHPMHLHPQHPPWAGPRFGAQSPDAVRKLMSLSEGTKPSKHALPPSANPSYAPEMPFGRPPSMGPSPATSPMMFPRRPQHHPLVPGRQHPSRQSGGRIGAGGSIPLSAESSSVNSFSALSIGGPMRKSVTMGSFSSGSDPAGDHSSVAPHSSLSPHPSDSSRTNSFSSADFPHPAIQRSVGVIGGGGGDRDSFGSFGGTSGFDSRRSSASISSFPAHSPPPARRHNSSSSTSSFHPPPPLPSIPPPPPPPVTHLLPPPYPSGFHNHHRAQQQQIQLQQQQHPQHHAPPPPPPSTPHPQARRAPPDYTVAAQMAAQISHARQLRQLNSSRRSFQRLPTKSYVASRSSVKRPDVAYEGDEDEDSQVSAV